MPMPARLQMIVVSEVCQKGLMSSALCSAGHSNVLASWRPVVGCSALTEPPATAGHVFPQGVCAQSQVYAAWVRVKGEFVHDQLKASQPLFTKASLEGFLIKSSCRVFGVRLPRKAAWDVELQRFRARLSRAATQ